VRRSLSHIYCQVIDDTTGTTLAAVSTLTPEVREAVKETKKTAAAKVVGQHVAKAVIKKGVAKVVFDRRGMPYHGRLKALAEGAREGGLQF
jgi:large subunit ribosomal protein L18